MKRVIIAIFLALSLSGCSTFFEVEKPETKTVKQEIFWAQTMFSAHVVVALKYMEQPRCIGVIGIMCSKQSVVDDLRMVILEADSAIKEAKTLKSMSKATLAVALVRRFINRLLFHKLVKGTQNASSFDRNRNWTRNPEPYRYLSFNT